MPETKNQALERKLRLTSEELARARQMILRQTNELALFASFYGVECLSADPNEAPTNESIGPARQHNKELQRLRTKLANKRKQLMVLAFPYYLLTLPVSAPLHLYFILKRKKRSDFR